jgi:hypothetical protein
MPKKNELILSLFSSLDDKHWDIISQLLGREIKPNEITRKNLLSKLFKKTIITSSRKGKARLLQNWTAEKISDITGIPWGTDDDSEIRPRAMGQRGPDVQMSPRVREKFPLTPECKNQESWKIAEYVQQAKTNCYPNTDFLVIFTKNGYENLALLNAEIFFNLMKGIEK